MTRRHFEAVAKGVREAPLDDSSARQLVAESLADVLALTNARFDRQRFIEACTREPD